MQKKIIALAVAALASSAAFAQSNVTVYGIVDVGGLYQDGQVGKNQFSVNSGVLSTSRLGFKGVEDLGNGLKAVFTLEYGLNVDANAGIGGTVTSTSTNARQQFVGLTGGFGTVIAGRLQTTGYDFTVAGSALGGSTTLGATSVVGGPGATGGTTLLSAFSRANNAVAYVSPSFGGVTFAYNHARMTEAALNTNTADGYANLLSASYAAGPITAGLAYGKLSAANTPLSDDHKEWGIRGGYDFGVAKLQATYQQQKNDATSAVGKDKKYVVSLSAPIGAKVAVIGEYAKLAKDSTSIADDSKAFTLASTYALSKRTTGYAAFVHLNPEGSDNNVNTYGVGVRHSF